MIQVMQQENIILKSGDKLPDLSTYDFLVVDCETSGISPHHGDRICGIVLGPRSLHVGYYLPIRHPENNLDLEEVLPWLQNLMNDPDRTWGGHNLKFDLAMLRADGIECHGQIIDTMLACSVFAGNELSYSLDAMTAKYVPGFKHSQYEVLHEYIQKTQGINISAKKNAASISANYSLVPVEILGNYALEDLAATRLLLDALNQQPMFNAPDNYGAKSWGTHDLIKNEMKLCRVIGDMEYKGIKIDKRRAIELRDKAEDEIEVLQEKMNLQAGFSFAPSEWSKMTKAFEAAGGRVIWWTKKKEIRGKQKLEQITDNKDDSTGRPNWNAASILNYLKTFREEGNQSAFDFVMNYREVMLRERVVSTYINSYLKKIDFNDILHGNFHQHRVITGRLSSSDPNLQNVSKSGGTIDQKAFEKFIGKKDDDALNRLMRGLFISQPGKVLVSIDWSQIEYRTAVWYSQDERMIKLWRDNPALDYHQDTQDLLDLDRDCCKIVNFGTIYGMSAKGLAATLSGMGRPTTKLQAQKILDDLFRARPALRRLITTVSNQAMRDGYVQNFYGRIVEIPREFAYKALNAIVQGAVGDMMREAMVRVDALIRDQKLPVDMLLTVHDECDFSMAEADVEWLAPLLAKEMMKCEFMNLPILCDIEVGTDWGNQLKLEDWLLKRKAS